MTYSIVLCLAASIISLSHGSVLPHERRFYDPNNSQQHSNVTNESQSFLETNSRVLNGDTVSNVPFIATQDLDSVEPGCQGVIIARDWFITAAHCYLDDVDIENSNVVAPLTQLSELTNAPDRKKYPIDEIYIHRTYNNRRNANDIALVKLQGRIREEDFVQVSLARERSEVHGDNAPVYIINFGHDNRGEDLVTRRLRRIEMRSYDQSTCGAVHGDIAASEFCHRPLETGLVTSTCPGDSGSGVFTIRNGQYHHVGIIAHGDGCLEREGNVQVSTDTSFYYKDISNLMNGNTAAWYTYDEWIDSDNFSESVSSRK